jgi:hypothetical protein
MELRHIHAGDIVRCELRGARFYALVRARDARGLEVEALDRRELPRGLVVHYVTARQVVEAWRKTSRAPRTAARRRAAREAVPA